MESLSSVEKLIGLKLLLIHYQLVVKYIVLMIIFLEYQIIIFCELVCIVRIECTWDLTWSSLMLC